MAYDDNFGVDEENESPPDVGALDSLVNREEENAQVAPPETTKLKNGNGRSAPKPASMHRAQPPHEEEKTVEEERSSSRKTQRVRLLLLVAGAGVVFVLSTYLVFFGNSRPQPAPLPAAPSFQVEGMGKPAPAVKKKAQPVVQQAPQAEPEAWNGAQENQGMAQPGVDQGTSPLPPSARPSEGEETGGVPSVGDRSAEMLTVLTDQVYQLNNRVGQIEKEIRGGGGSSAAKSESEAQAQSYKDAISKMESRLGELESSLKSLQDENSVLKEENQKLKKSLDELQKKNEYLRSLESQTRHKAEDLQKELEKTRSGSSGRSDRESSQAPSSSFSSSKSASANGVGVWKLVGMSDKLAVLINRTSGESATVKVGDSLPGGISVTGIDSGKGKVFTTRGEISR